MIAKTLKVRKLTPSKAKNVFTQICQDILASETSRVGSKTNQDRVRQIVRELVTRKPGVSKTVHPPVQTDHEDFSTIDTRMETVHKEKSLIEV